MSLTISSPDFSANGNIPSVHTCEGANTSPALAWSGVPPSTKTLALIMDDPDAPDPAAPQRTWVHWVLYNIPAEATGLAANVQAPELPAGTRIGENDWKDPAYGGPCPPIGRHRYFFKLYALSEALPERGHMSKAELEKEMDEYIIDKAELVGTYQKQR